MGTRLAHLITGAIVAAIGGTAHAAELIAGRCHMDYCSWFSIESRDISATNPQGALVKVESRWWQSHHPKGYDKRAPRKGGELGVSYVFCSKTAPALIDRDDSSRKWLASSIAPGNPDDIAGANITGYIFYFAVCHGLTVTEAGLYDQTVTLGKKFGYSVKPSDEDTQRTIDAPTDILKR